MALIDTFFSLLMGIGAIFVRVTKVMLCVSLFCIDYMIVSLYAVSDNATKREYVITPGSSLNVAVR